jgi:hypothetical protein
MIKVEKKDLIGKEFQGRKASRVIDIWPAGTFTAFYEAEKTLRELGYRTGSMCRNEPIGFMHGYDYVAKWYNLSQEDKSSLHGLLLPLDEFREGGARIVFFEEPHLGE